jgi:N-methylhydantoinase A
MHRIGIDVGGTFTDVVLLDESTGQVWSTKVATTPQDPAVGALNGLNRILELSGTPAETIGFIGHGTTIATNMIIEGKGARAALLTSEGFRDILEIRRAWRHDRADLYDLFFDNPPDLVPRSLRREVPERVLHDGTVEKAMSEPGLDEQLAALQRDGVESIAICFINSHVNPVHERQALERTRQRLQEAFVTGSIEVNPEIMEYERTSTTVMNAVLGPRCGQYTRRFESQVRGAGLGSPIYFMQSNGGLTPPDIAAGRPVTLLESGPAGGVTAAVRLCQRIGVTNAITGDMGGTSFDVSLIRDGKPEMRNSTEIKSYTVRCPNIDIISVGAGGGSIAWIDDGGGVRIGPESAGADPGPACYGRGGERPTVTDCNLLLGYVDPESFSAGDLKLDVAAATQAIERHLAEPLGVDIVEAARTVRAVANALMAQAVRLVTVERGYDPRDFSYLPFGGAGPVHAVDIARELQMPQVILPPLPGLFSAFGMLVADMLHDLQASVISTLDEITPEELESRFGDLESQAQKLMRDAGIDPALVAIERRADCCYLGQGETMQIELGSERIDQDAITALGKDFEHEHKRHWNFVQADRPVRIVNIRLRVAGQIGSYATGQSGQAARDGELKPFGQARLYLGDGWASVPRYRRSDLAAGDTLDGPLVVEEPSTRLPIDRGDTLTVDSDHNLLIKMARR